MTNTKYTIWGITWFILCFIGIAVEEATWFLQEILERHGTYVTQADFTPLFIILGIGLLLATIIIDVVKWYVAKKTAEVKT